MHKRASRVPTYLSRLPTLMWVEIQSNQLLTEVASSRICLMTANPGRTGRDLLDMLDPDVTAQAIEAGYLDVTPARVSATYEGRKRLDSLLAALLG